MSLKLKSALLASLLVLLCGCMSGSKVNPQLDGADKGFILTGITGLEQISQLTGERSPNRTDRYAVYGTDLGSMMNDGERTYFVFGDTFGERAPDQIGGGGSYWRSNTMAYTTDMEPADGITFENMVTDEFGTAKELLPSVKIDYEEMTKIPTHGIAAGGALYVYYMSVNHWGDPGKWDANYSSVAKSVDNGETWELQDQLRWPGDSNFIQVSPYKVKNEAGGTDIYFWGIPAGRYGGVQLMKVGEENIENLSEYEYYSGLDDDGNPRWSTDKKDAQNVVDDTVGELSVVWNSYLERWLMTYLKEGQGVVIREGMTPWGQWGEPLDLVRAEDYPGLYGPYMNDRYTENDGRTIYFTLSLWDPYNVFWYKASLEK
ncbi:DUF4185 domain-containing protein [Paenibacillus lautus]|uniref:DUF4185 domain-containing protein n=1 Tax=Paenibacillus lautus TaxID=1401 RepID=UPI003D2B89EE